MANKTLYPFGVGGQTPSGIDIVDDLTTGGHDKAASAETVKELAQYVFMGSGTFAEAYDKARNSVVNFPWMLNDTDDEGNVIKKMIWHIGNKRFMDSVGAEINGKKNGITVVVSAACDMKVNSKTFELSEGENNISLEEIDATNNQAAEPRFYDSGTDTENKTYLTKIDFGGFKISAGWDTFASYPNVTEIDRMIINKSSWSNGMLYRMSKLERIKLSGNFSGTSYQKLLKSCPKLLVADLSDYHVTIGDGTSGILEWFSLCGALKEVDIRNVDTTQCKSFQSIFQPCTSLKKLTIGNFSNGAVTNVTNMFGSVSGCTLICTTTTPPVLKNCAFSDGVAQDEYSSTYDWVAWHISAIYVPSDAVQAYKTNTYVENGTVGVTGWSKYADIIHDIAEYNG